MNEDKTLENTGVENEDAIMPDGYAEGDDIFNEKSWASNAGAEDPAEDDFFADEPSALDELEEDSKPGDKAADEDPTTGTKEQTPPTDTADETGTEPATPTTEEETPAQEPASNKLKFKARIDHEDVDAEIDESELPTLYQKATATDRYQAKLAKVNPMMERLERMAKANGYDTVEEMLDAQETYEREEAVERLVKQGTPKEIAEDYVDRRFGRAATAAPTPAEKQVDTAAAPGGTDTKPQTPPARKWEDEVRELWTLRPDLKGTTLPSEVAAAAANGQNLALAYFAYEAKQSKAAVETLRKENEIFKQNAAAAAKAPVKGTTGGGATDTRPADPFLQGFDSDW